MPAVIPVHAELRSRLKTSVQRALTLNERLEGIIAERSRQPSGGFHGKIDFSQAPWNASAANAIMDLHAEARDAEGRLRAILKLPYRERGGSDDNTRRALEAVLRLSQAADDFSVRSNTRWLDAWCRRAAITLGETEAPRRLPRVEGHDEPGCPWCGNHTLRMFPLEGLIKCVNPDCRDEEKRRPVAQLVYSEYARDLVLLWMDNVVGLPA